MLVNAYKINSWEGSLAPVLAGQLLYIIERTHPVPLWQVDKPPGHVTAESNMEFNLVMIQ